jgi:hypothetical protein
VLRFLGEDFDAIVGARRQLGLFELLRGVGDRGRETMKGP